MARVHSNKSHPDSPAFQKTRDKIKGTLLIKALEAHALNKGKKMDPSQVSAALGLIKKVLPDLTATELSGPGGKDLQPILNINVGDGENG